MSLLISSLCILVVLWATRTIRRVFFHPLSRYPGSIIAVISPSWYEWYWNYHHNGTLLFEIKRQHLIHGPVVRIGPNELHVNDPEVYISMTKVGSSFTKDPNLYTFIAFPNTSIGYTDPAGHRVRRQVLTPAFSPARVRELEPMVQEKVTKLVKRLEAFAASQSHSPVNINRVCKALTIDVISDIVIGRDFQCLDHPTFKNEFIERLHAAFDMGWTATAFPTLTKMSLALPSWLSRSLFPIPILLFKEECSELVRTYLRTRSRPSQTGHRKNRSIVIDMLMDPQSAKDHRVLSTAEVNDEVIMLLTAGNDTTSNSMIIGIFQICQNFDVYTQLQHELGGAFPNLDGKIDLDTAKSLPYLNAVIKEILRFSSPVPGRLPRVVPSEGFQLHGHVLPAGTVLHTSAYLLNRNSDVWSNPDTFDPDRWLNPDSGRLDKYMASFYRGTRQCLGKDLAWCELYLLLANLFRRFEVSIFNTTDSDMEWVDLILVNFKGKNFQAVVKKKVN